MCELGSVVEGDGAAKTGIEPCEHVHDGGGGFGRCLASQLGDDGEARLSLGHNQHRPGFSADHEIALPVAALRAVIDLLRALVD